MNRLLLAAAAALVLLAACYPSHDRRTAPQSSPANAGAPPAIVKVKATRSGIEIPSVIQIPNAVGEVVFLHEKHTRERSIQCVDCHHQINAKKLNTPHPDYLTSSWINCKTCHSDTGKTANVYTCSACHRTSPADIANETLSAKVVIHQQCWKCHPVNSGKEASSSCELCHSGKKAL